MVKSSTSVIVFGAAGRMGARICALASEDPECAITAALTRDGSPREGERVVSAAGAQRSTPLTLQTPQKLAESTRCDVVIDFSSESGLEHSLAVAQRCGAALLVGTTGLSAGAIDSLRRAAAHRPVLLSPNTSLGVAVLASLVRSAARVLGPAYECSIVEAHHSRKKDAPSGTAIRLAFAARASGHPLKDDQVLAIRGGDVIGEHTVRFAGPGEYIELTHRATSRDLFALGALRVSKWLSVQKPGWYTTEDALGIAG